MIMEKTCREYVEVLASKLPIPGGGCATALVGAIGMALSTMVGSFSVGKKKFVAYEDELKELMNKGYSLQNALMWLSEKDAMVFDRLYKVYGFPETTEEERRHKQRALNRETQNAIDVQLDMIRRLYDSLEVHKRMSEIGNEYLLSDIGSGVCFLRAALLAAKMNVIVNYTTTNDEEYKQDVEREMNTLVRKGLILADEINEDVTQRLMAKAKVVIDNN